MASCTSSSADFSFPDKFHPILSSVRMFGKNERSFITEWNVTL